MKKVIFVPGFTGGIRDMYIMKKRLKGYELIYFPYNTWLNDSIVKYSKELGFFINKLKLKKGEKVNIIGVSAGGIITEYYVKFIDNKKVDKIVTVCSPFKGTWISSFLFKKKKGLQDLGKNSPILKKINSKKLIGVKEKNFWSKFDFLVPGESGKGKNPEHTWFFIHAIIHWWPPISRRIEGFLK